MTNELLVEIEILKEKNKKLEKALDKACDKLFRGKMERYMNKTCSHGPFIKPMTKEQWKEWCLRDE